MLTTGFGIWIILHFFSSPPVWDFGLSFIAFPSDLGWVHSFKKIISAFNELIHNLLNSIHESFLKWIKLSWINTIITTLPQQSTLFNDFNSDYYFLFVGCCLPKSRNLVSMLVQARKALSAPSREEGAKARENRMTGKKKREAVEEKGKERTTFSWRRKAQVLSLTNFAKKVESITVDS